MGFFIGMLSNVLANLIFWILLGIVFWLTGTVVARRFSQFFGLRNVQGVTVYLSNLYKPTASLSRRPEGYVIPLHELRAAQSVEQILGSAPLRLPDLVRGLVDSLWLRGQIKSEISVSPPDSADADLSQNLIVIGGSVRNSIRAQYVKSGLPVATFLGEESRAEVHRPIGATTTVLISQGDNKSERTYTNRNVAILEKRHDVYRGITVFFCAGVRGDASWMACEYLTRNWKSLAREFGNADFYICLGVPLTDRYLETYRKPDRLEVQGGVA
jgi:hypothetical protein